MIEDHPGGMNIPIAEKWQSIAPTNHYLEYNFGYNGLTGLMAQYSGLLLLSRFLALSESSIALYSCLSSIAV